MIRGSRPHQGGYTIIEVIIVLTVTSLLLASAILLFRSRIPRTQFSNAVVEFDTKLRDTMGQVVSGYYPSSNVPDLGTNEDSIFLGRVIQFGPNVDGCSPGSDKCDEINSYTVSGRRVVGIPPNDTVVTTLADANPKVVSGSDDTMTLGYGLHVTKVLIGGTSTNLAGLGFIQTFGSVGVGGLPSGTPQVQLLPIVGDLGEQPASFTDATFGGRLQANPPNPSQGIVICLKSGTTDQVASITLGGNQDVLGTKIDIAENGAAAGC